VVGYIEIAKSPVAMAHDEEAVAPPVTGHRARACPGCPGSGCSAR